MLVGAMPEPSLHPLILKNNPFRMELDTAGTVRMTQRAPSIRQAQLEQHQWHTQCSNSAGPALHQLLLDSGFNVKDAPKRLGVYHPANANASSEHSKATIDITNWSGHLETLAGAAATEEFNP